MLNNIEANYILLNVKLNALLVKHIEGELNHHGISFTEFLIMNCLSDASSRTARRIDLANEIGLSASGVTRLLGPMEKNKLIEKEVNPRDARVSLVKLTEVGLRIYDECSRVFEHRAKSLTSKLSETQLMKLTELSSKLL